ncbi:hypothetical protein [Paenibacillus medicaginis]|uniref:Uncharacterized protein n=1 Tax=Paenibacillus medicaginis TaxID=1470560 RepID=A0ABV5BUG4_9BACL
MNNIAYKAKHDAKFILSELQYNRKKGEFKNYKILADTLLIVINLFEKNVKREKHLVNDGFVTGNVQFHTLDNLFFINELVDGLEYEIKEIEKESNEALVSRRSPSEYRDWMMSYEKLNSIKVILEGDSEKSKKNIDLLKINKTDN